MWSARKHELAWLRVHNEAGYRRLGRLVASFGQLPDAEIYTDYEADHKRRVGDAGPTRMHYKPIHRA